MGMGVYSTLNNKSNPLDLPVGANTVLDIPKNRTNTRT